jgi:hypothetical protein
MAQWGRSDDGRHEDHPEQDRRGPRVGSSRSVGVVNVREIGGRHTYTSSRTGKTVTRDAFRAEPQ